MRKLRLLPVLALVAVTACSSSKSNQPNASYYLGETYLRRGQLNQAIDAYKVYITDPGHNPDLYLPRAYYMLAYAYYRQGKYDDALATLDELERRFPEMDSVQVWTLRGDVSRDLGNRVQAIQEYDEAWRFAGPTDRIRLETRVQATLKEMNVTELTQVERLVSDPVVHDLTAKQLVGSGGSLIAAEDETAVDDNAVAVAAEVVPEPIPRAQERRESAAAAKAARDAEKTSRTSLASNKEYGTLEESPPLAIEPEPVVATGPAKVLCLAPLSGSEAQVGQQVCDSVTSAFSAHADRVIKHDADDTPEAARAAWMTAVEDLNVVGAVAWLPPASLQSVAPLVEASGVPMIVVSGAGGAEGRYVRGWSVGRSAEVNGLVRYMLDTVHVSKFGVLYPDTTSGNDYLDRFTAAARSNGGQVVGKQFYRPGSNPSAVLETVRKWRGRDVNVDAIFIPDQLGDAQSLVLELNERYPDLIVLGLSSWNGATSPVRAFIASGSDTAAYDAASAFYGAIVGAGADTRSAVAARLEAVESGSVASNVTPTILRLEGGSSSGAGG